MVRNNAAGKQKMFRKNKESILKVFKILPGEWTLCIYPWGIIIGLCCV